MPCNFCRPQAKRSRPNMEQLCEQCTAAARHVVAFVADGGCVDPSNPSSQGVDDVKENVKEFENLSKWVHSCAMENEQLRKKVDFLGNLCQEFGRGTYPDILLKPGDDAPFVPAHQIMLAARSEVLKKVLDTDEFKPAATGTITFTELSGEELLCLLEFLYTGSLCREKLEKHAFSLLVAAEKYEIAYLLEVCEGHIIQSLKESNVLEALDFADAHNRISLKEKCFKFLADNMKDVVFSAKYLEWAVKNPTLSVEVMRAFTQTTSSRPETEPLKGGSGHGSFQDTSSDSDSDSDPDSYSD